MKRKATLSLVITDSIAKIEKKISKALILHINKSITKNKAKVTTNFKKNIEQWVYKQPEMQSLLKLAKPNELSSLFGLKFKTNEATVKAVVESISNSINVNISKINDNYQGKIQFNCQPVDFRNLLDLPEGFVFSEKDASLHWMDWLLNKGLQTIVYGYSYVPGRGFGRSGGGKMAEGGFFRVPPQYSGTSQNNFVTRAFKSREREITSILQELFKWA